MQEDAVTRMAQSVDSCMWTGANDMDGANDVEELDGGEGAECAGEL